MKANKMGVVKTDLYISNRKEKPKTTHKNKIDLE